MSTRFSWLLGVLVLFFIAALVACSGSKYTASSDGLVLVPTQGSAILQSFSFNLSNGHIASISNPPSTAGVPTSIVLDPAGAFAYVIVNANSSIKDSTTGIATFSINSNGRASYIGTTPPPPDDPNPVALAMDSSGKFLFVADGLGTDLISVYSIGSNASLTLVPGNFTFPATAVPPNFVALAATPVSFPTANAACSSGANPLPTAEYLYAADAANDRVWEFSVDMSTGALGNPLPHSEVLGFDTGSVPGGVAVDACNRFVYVANGTSNNVSAYTICNGTVTASLDCTAGADGSLVAVAGSPFAAGNAPGPLAIDPFANFLYVVDGGSFQISDYRISQITGALTALTPATVATGSTPKSIAIRGDGSWIFVANYGSASVSQYSITPATGALSPLPTITTDNNPWGVAVK